MERIERQASGFTLIETILYVALSGAVSIVLLQAIGLLQDIRTRHIVTAEVNDAAEWTLSRVSDRIQSSGIDAPEPGDSASQLDLSDGWSISLVGGRVVEQTATRSLSLTSPVVLISDLVFENMGASSSDIVQVSFTAAFGSGVSGAAVFEYEREYETSISIIEE